MLDQVTDFYGDTPNSAGDTPLWIVVNTQPHKERVAIENLRRQCYPTYCPVIRTRIRHARKTRDVLRPLFPSYIFVDISGRRWRPIWSTLGVRSIIRNGDEPAMLDPRIIEGLRLREIDGAIVRPPNPYQVGQDVRLAGGPLDGLVAKIIVLDERDRVVVLLDLLSRSVKAHVTVEQLRAS